MIAQTLRISDLLPPRAPRPNFPSFDEFYEAGKDSYDRAAAAYGYSSGRIIAEHFWRRMAWIASVQGSIASLQTLI
jgi:hypothetical protein